MRRPPCQAPSTKRTAIEPQRYNQYVIESFIEKHNLPKYRLNQFNEQFYKQAIHSFDELTTWPKDLREQLKKELEFNSLIPEKQVHSQKDNTTKVLFKRKTNGQYIETVLMRYKDGRNSICVSCMVGCPVGCSFCATGKLGFHGNLSAREIVDQVMYFKRQLVKENQTVTNIVFMGMGEPMLNLKEVLGAIDTFTSPEKLAMSSRRITVSTSGYAPQLKTLLKTGFKGKLAISLHAPNQELRETMMPVAKAFDLEQLFTVLKDYEKQNNKIITYEYILIDHINDQEKHAKQLAKLLKNRLAHVNLIPYNPIFGVDYKRSSKNNIHKFSKILTDAGISNTIRVTMGDDVNAACGQLAGQAG